jgi:hypothetical protein
LIGKSGTTLVHGKKTIDGHEDFKSVEESRKRRKVDESFTFKVIKNPFTFDQLVYHFDEIYFHFGPIGLPLARTLTEKTVKPSVSNLKCCILHKNKIISLSLSLYKVFILNIKKRLIFPLPLPLLLPPFVSGSFQVRRYVWSSPPLK